MFTQWQIPVGVVSIIMGFLLSTQIKNQMDYRTSLPGRRVEELVVMLKNAEQSRDELAKEVVRQRDRSGRSSLDDISTGHVAVTGPGLEVRIKDSPKPLQKDEDPNVAVFHNDDLLRIVNELRAGGAEVIAVNDQRLVDTSEIACAGPTILVNQTRLAPPYIIKAIGNPDVIAAAINLRGGIIDYLQFYGIQVNISKRTEVQIPMYSGGSHYRFAKPVVRQDVAP